MARGSATKNVLGHGFAAKSAVLVRHNQKRSVGTNKTKRAPSAFLNPGNRRDTLAALTYANTGGKY